MDNAVSPTLRPLGPEECRQTLEQLRPRIGDHRWLWWVLRLRMARTGWFPRGLHKRLTRSVGPQKPYFVGTLSDGTRFLGDVRDVAAANYAVSPDAYGTFFRFLKSAMPETGDYADVGANIGLTACVMAKAFPDRAVHAFEPTPGTALCAASTFALNGLRNATLYPCAVGDADGDLTFYEARGFSSMASAVKTDAGQDWAEIKVPCRTLDGMVDAGGIGRLGFVKIDVEGYEFSVVRGAASVLGRDRPRVLYEYNLAATRALGWSPEDIARRLPGYQFQTLDEDMTLRPYAPMEGTEGHVDIYCRPE